MYLEQYISKSVIEFQIYNLDDCGACTDKISNS